MNFKKISYDEEIDNVPDFDDVFKSLPECIKDYFNESLNDLKTDIISAINKCESPIEQLLSLHLKKIVNSTKLADKQIEVIAVDNQGVFEIKGNSYRVDFDVYVQDYETERSLNFIIECDGYEFHQKNKEQVQKDYEKTRLFQQKGIVVIRFSGSEIFASPSACVRQIEDIIIGCLKAK